MDFLTKLTNPNEIRSALQIINDRINGCGFNFQEASDGYRGSIAYFNSNQGEKHFIILASFDFSYYHDLELVFYEPVETDIPKEASWWDHWEKDQVELNEDYTEGFEFRFNTGTHGDHQYYIRCSGFSYIFEHVSYNK